MTLRDILQFKGTWRTYQDRVLKRADKYLMDGKIHIVAAPGSGKTTLGIELMHRISKPALVLAPSITIREQWVARIEEAFLKDGLNGDDFFSQDIKHPKLITVATYQALHSAMTRFAGELKDGEEEESETSGRKKKTAVETEDTDTGIAQKEVVDFSGFDLVATMKEAGIGVLCLDECHHLRSEWWKALEDFRAQIGNVKIIALTATPPYDSERAMWNRYCEMCGEIDEEITIPELVKEGSLCPHQDFVYFNYPTKEETDLARQFKQKSDAIVSLLVTNQEFASVIATHKGLTGEMSDDALLEDSDYLSSILIYLQAAGLSYPARLRRLLGPGRVPAMSAKWMEKLLQGFLYSDTDSYNCTKEYREQIMDELKTAGMIEKKKVMLQDNPDMQRMITRSKGKCNSIRDIVFHEYEATGDKLRLLVLTDYIKKEYEKVIGDTTSDVLALGVLPIFEMLRRENVAKGKNIRFGVLCGTIVIIPSTVRAALTKAVEGKGQITFSKLGQLPLSEEGNTAQTGQQCETSYVKVNAVGDAHFLTSAVTEIFTNGFMEVLIGTKSLLGEGWDSPCINSLILASFVGSFMLSNQMRGRAIRVFRQVPDKTSNIWHLVCLPPWAETLNSTSNEVSEDFTLLTRRMEHFLGLHYTENTIENGIDRLSIIKEPPFTQKAVSRMNEEMLELSGHRSELKNRWQNALAIFNKMEIVDETEVNEKAATARVFINVARQVVAIGVIIAALLIFYLAGSGFIRNGITRFLLRVLIGIMIGLLLFRLPRLLSMSSPIKRLRVFARGLRRAMLDKGMFEDNNNRIEVTTRDKANYNIALLGGTSKDKEQFSTCVNEFFASVENQRYLLVKSGNHNGLDGFFCVPEAFGRKKEDAVLFSDCMRRFIGNYDLVYTRNEDGRALLYEGRLKALANSSSGSRGGKKRKKVRQK